MFCSYSASVIHHRLIQRVARIAIDGAADARASTQVNVIVGGCSPTVSWITNIISIASTTMYMDFRIIAYIYDRETGKRGI